MKKFKDIFEKDKFYRIQYTTQYPIVVRILKIGEDFITVKYHAGEKDTKGKTLVFQIDNIVFVEDVTESEAHHTNF